MSLELAMIKKDGRQLISMRYIHQGIGSNRQFTNWADVRIKKWKLEEGKSYLTNLLKTSKPEGGRPQIDYLVPYVVGVAIASSENTDTSRQFSLKIWKFIENKMNNETKQLTINYALSRTNDKSILKQENDSLKKENDHLVSIISKQNKKPNKINNHIGYAMKNVFESII